MEGSLSKLPEIVELKKKYKVPEAHKVHLAQLHIMAKALNAATVATPNATAGPNI